MREIEFRGRIGREWVYGSLEVFHDNFCKITNYLDKPDVRTSIVEPETVGQYVGKKDKFDKKIYSGDILESYHFTDREGKKHYHYHQVVWSNKFLGWWVLNCDSKKPSENAIQLWVYVKKWGKKYGFKVVGNIHDGEHMK